MRKDRMFDATLRVVRKIKENCKIGKDALNMVLVQKVSE